MPAPLPRRRRAHSIPAGRPRSLGIDSNPNRSVSHCEDQHGAAGHPPRAASPGAAERHRAYKGIAGIGRTYDRSLSQNVHLPA